MKRSRYNEKSENRYPGYPIYPCEYNWLVLVRVRNETHHRNGFFLSRDKRCLAGVTIKPYGLNTSYFWPERLLGKPIESTTDKNGLASLEYPLLFRAFERRSRNGIVGKAHSIFRVAD